MSSKDYDVDLPKVEQRESRADAERRDSLTKSLLFKIDTRVLPLLALLFLCSFLDRTNVGNAKIIGMEKDLGISNIQYNQGLAVFYATYIARHVTLSPVVVSSLSLELFGN
ncbi:major facilitator superfamily transporter [Colletotrichum musicola]|uniref:Major facilitator superfamily transporter n=1 Tax=Colletotrichum musicola TaxID=2175873 RepID=A0A8H6J286_9PEZI|nr:major facilitator superfamily transporter [Colletotrichum musicola]